MCGYQWEIIPFWEVGGCWGVHMCVAVQERVQGRGAVLSLCGAQPLVFHQKSLPYSETNKEMCVCLVYNASGTHTYAHAHTHTRTHTHTHARTHAHTHLHIHAHTCTHTHTHTHTRTHTHTHTHTHRKRNEEHRASQQPLEYVYRHLYRPEHGMFCAVPPAMLRTQEQPGFGTFVEVCGVWGGGWGWG